MPRPSLLPTEALQIGQDLEFRNQLEEGLSSLKSAAMLEDTTTRLRRMGSEPTTPDPQAYSQSPSFQPMPDHSVAGISAAPTSQNMQLSMPSIRRPDEPMIQQQDLRLSMASSGYGVEPEEASVRNREFSPAAPGARPVTPRTGSAAPGGAIDNSSTEAFIRSAYPHFLQAAGGNKDLAEMMLAKATSENGKIGKGGDLMGNNFSGIKGKGPTGKSQRLATHEIINGQRVDIEDDFAVFDTPQEGANGFIQFLEDNPRYHKALAEFRQTGDTQRLFRAVNDAGYATDAGWAEKVAARRDSIVAPITRTIPDQPPVSSQPTQPQMTTMSVTNGVTPLPSGAPAWGTYTPETLTPNQYNEGLAQGLTAGEALAVCGPAAAVAFARVNGRNPTLREAKELAQAQNLWDEGAGMHGPASQVQLLQKMGVPATLREGADWASIRAEVEAGRPVIVDTPKHYYTVTGYDPQTGTFEFGQSAAVLKASGGRTRFRPEEIPGLGMGAPRATIVMGGGR